MICRARTVCVPLWLGRGTINTTPQWGRVEIGRFGRPKHARFAVIIRPYRGCVLFVFPPIIVFWDITPTEYGVTMHLTTPTSAAERAHLTAPAIIAIDVSERSKLISTRLGLPCHRGRIRKQERRSVT